jgi:hypothetical protein
MGGDAMRFARIAGACLAVAATLGSAGAALATTEYTRPNYGRCLKVTAAKTGTYGDVNCKTTGGKKAGEYEWYPGFMGPKPLVKRGFTYNLKPGTGAKFETTAQTSLTCTGESGKGEITGAQTTSMSAVTFTGCSSEGFTCKSPGQAAGTLRTSTAFGEMAWIEEPDKAGSYFGFPNDIFFTCTGGVFKLEHRITDRGTISPRKEMKMILKETLKFTGKKGIPKPEYFDVFSHWVEGPLHFQVCPPAGFEGCVYASLSASFVQTYEEKIEVFQTEVR